MWPMLVISKLIVPTLEGLFDVHVGYLFNILKVISYNVQITSTEMCGNLTSNAMEPYKHN